jgi:hypothetical protein
MKDVKTLIQEKVVSLLNLKREIYVDTILTESVAKRIIRVNSKGQRRKVKICPKGFRLAGDKCIPMTSSQKVAKRSAIRKAVRTKKADTSGKKRAIKKRIIAIRRRKKQGL